MKTRKLLTAVIVFLAFGLTTLAQTVPATNIQTLCIKAIQPYNVNEGDATHDGSTYAWSIAPATPSAVIAGNGTHAITIDWTKAPSGTYTLQVTETSIDGCVSSAVSATINLSTTPLAPVAPASQSFCTASRVANLTATGTNLQWYAASTAGTALASTTVLVAGTTYYVSQTTGTCESTRTAVAVTISPLTAPTASAQTFCTSATVANLVATGTAIKWYAAATGGTALANTTALVKGTTYYASQTVGTCESTRTAVAVTITPLTAPTAVAQTFCTSATVANLVATGTAIKWYAALTGGTALASSTALVTGTTYYTSQTVGTCESTRTAVVVTITPTTAPTASTQTFCNSATVANLVATGTAIKWYAALTGGTALANTTTLVTGTTYYASQTVGTCESTRKAVAVTISPTVAPSAVAQTFCTASTVANLVATGTVIKWYAALTGGTALASTTALATGTTYYASQTVGSCESTRTAVAVTITPLTAPTAIAQTFCTASTVANLVATGTAVKWYAALTGGTALANTTALTTGTYYASQTVGTCESARTAVAVSINDPQITASATTVCAGTNVNLSVNATLSTISDPLALYNNFVFSSLETTTGRNRIWKKNSATADYTPIFSDSFDRTNVVVSNDKQEIIYVKYNRSIASPNPQTTSTMTQAWVCRSTINGTNETTLFEIPNYNRDAIYSIDWTNDKSKILYVKGNDAYPNLTRDADVFEYTITTNTQTNVTNDFDYSKEVCRYSKNSNKIFYSRNMTTWVGWNVFLFKKDNAASIPVQVVDGTGGYSYPASTIVLVDVSADGNIVYYRRRGTDYLYSKNLTTGTEQLLSNVPGNSGITIDNGIIAAASATNSINLITNNSIISSFLIPQTSILKIDDAYANNLGSADNIDLNFISKWSASQASTVLWSTGETTATINPSPTATTTYWCDVTTNGVTCRKNVTITVTPITAPTAVAQTFCTASTVANLVATGTAIKWYAALTGGTALASTTALVTATTYYASQTVGTCESARTAVAVTITPVTAPTAVAQTFCTSATVANLVATGTAIKWYAALTGGTALASTTAIVTGATYYASQTFGTCESSRTPVAVTITPAAAPTATAQTFCTASTVANLVAIGTAIKWYAALTGGTALASTTPLVTGTTYYASQTIGTCESTRTVVPVTITPATPPPASAQTFCTSATVDNLIAIGTAIKWYAAAIGGATLANTTALTTGTYYASQTVGTCESTRTAVAVTITPLTAPIAVAQTFCTSATVANLVATGTAIKWYETAIGGTALASATPLVTGATYYASQTVGTCESTRTAVVVTITPATAPTAVAQTFCASATVDNLIATGTTIKWYAALTGGTALANTTTLVTRTTYYASQTIGTCESTRTAVAVTITPITAPTAVAQTFCTSATVANLVATGTAAGTAIQWYAAATGGTALASSTALTNGTRYYASQAVNECESTRTAVLVTITPITAPTAVAQTFCASATVANLVATGTAIKWYAASTGGTVLASTTALLTDTTYYASQTVNECESTRTAVAVTITPIPAPIAVAQTFCTSAIVANLVATGTATKWYAALTGGTALANTTALVTGTTYYASQTVGTCESTRAEVPVMITPKTTPTFTEFSPICEGAALEALPTTSNNAITGTWSPELNNTTTSSYTFTPTDGQCANSASTIITVNSVPAPTGASTQTFVLGQTLNNIEVNGTGIVWYGTPSDAMNRTNVLPNSTVLLNETTYYATQTVGSCTSSDYLAVQVTPSLDVKWFKNSNMIVYPIPVSTILHIKHSNSVVFDKLVLSDVTGKVILIQTQNTDQINVERFAEGTYFIKAFSGEEYFISKFIKK